MKTQKKYWEEIVKDRAFFYRVAYRFTGNEDSAKELLQDTLLKAFEKSYQFNGGSLRAWVKRIMWTRHLRLCQIRGRVTLVDIDEAYDISDGKEAIDVVVLDEQLNVLDNIQKMLISLYVKGYKYEEISEIIDMPVSTARVKIHRAKERIRQKK